MKIAELFDQLKKDPKKMMILAGIVAAFAVFFYFNVLLRPQLAGLFNKLAKVGTLKSELKKARADIANIDKMKAEIASYDDKMARYGELLPSDQGIQTLLENLSEMARGANMKIVSIVPVEEKENKAPRTQAYRAIPIAINARAGYHELGRFLSTLENSGRFMKVVDIRVKSNPTSPKKHDVELVVMTYVLL